MTVSAEVRDREPEVGNRVSDLTRIGVVGGGLMGSGIIEVAARAGLDVVSIEVSSDAAKTASTRVESSLRKAESRGKLTSTDVADALQRIVFETDLDALSDRDLVVEAASESESVKLELFRQLGRLLDDRAILASNTSSIPIVKLGAVSGRPDRVLGVHFFNPAPVMRLIEIIPSLTTSAETVDRITSFVCTTLGKEPIKATDRAGFVVNSLLVPYILSAIRMYEAGYASATDIDSGMVLGRPPNGAPRSGRPHRPRHRPRDRNFDV
jgi:3-hydroxybutyryl-CoA dehydrogenase